MHKVAIIGIALAATLVILLLFGTMYFGVMAPSSLMASKEMAISSPSDFGVRHSTDSVNKISSTGSAESIRAPSPKTPSVPDAMYFEDYGTNVFVKSSEDRLSTFALDVDTASFTIAKNYIMRGMLPPTDAIRPEEFINYFSQEYSNPQNEDFTIYGEGAKSPFGDDIYYLKIGVKAKEAEKRLPVKLTFVVDVSGSMNTDNRLGLVKKSLRYLVDQLDEQDEIGIVKYNTEATIVNRHRTLENKQQILNAIDSLSAGGSTNAEDGLILGYELANEAFDSDYSNRVILLSDGVANVGNTDADSILGQLKSYKEKGIGLSAIGVGLGNYNDVLLEQIADKADGNYAYVNDFNEAKRVFSEQLTETLQVAAYDAKIQVDFNPDVVSEYRLIGYENRAIEDNSFRNDEEDAGELGAGHEATAIYELKLKNTNSIAGIGTVSLRWKDSDTKLAKEITREFTGSKDIHQNFYDASERFRLSVAVARFAQILKLSHPPPSINTVYDIIQNIPPLDDTETDLGTVVYNAKRLIELEQR